MAPPPHKQQSPASPPSPPSPARIFSFCSRSSSSSSCSLLLLSSLFLLTACFIFFDLLRFSPVNPLGGFVLNLDIATIRPSSSSSSSSSQKNLAPAKSLPDPALMPENPRDSVQNRSRTTTASAPSSGDSQSGDSRSSDSRSGNSRSGDSRSGDSRSGDSRSATAPSSGPIEEGPDSSIDPSYGTSNGSIGGSWRHDSTMRESNRIEGGGDCDVLDGSWVRDESYPLYSSAACPFIDDGFRCQENGRPDDGYLRWRWKPARCEIPRFEGRELLERLRGKRLVFVGDSLGRNQWESMLCLLLRAANGSTRVYEVNGEPISKHKGFLDFRFESYDCHIEYYRSPFLVPQTRAPKDAPDGVRTVLRLDSMDWSSPRWAPRALAIVFNAGHWWNYEKTIRGGCYFQDGAEERVNKSMEVKAAFAAMMRTWREWVSAHVDLGTTRVFFRTYAPVHFTGGTWRSGGQCHLETEPSLPINTTSKEDLGEEEPYWTNEVIGREVRKLGSAAARILDITRLSDLRRDAHPSIYNVGPSQPRPINRQDCSHWCLPGLPDTWNQLLSAALLDQISL